MDADGLPFGCLLISERRAPSVTPQMIDASLPHLSVSERSDLMQHYLGNITWPEVCKATGVDYDELPTTV